MSFGYHTTRSFSPFQDTVALQPHTFGLDPADVLARELNKKYANRVLQDIGLVITVFDLIKCSEGKVRYGDGCLWYKGMGQIGGVPFVTFFHTSQSISDLSSLGRSFQKSCTAK